MRYLESLCGTYALVRRATHTSSSPIAIGKNGRIGTMPVRRGFYFYVGSAFGQGGVRGRLSHHLDSHAPLKWNIDYLKVCTHFEGLWFTHNVAKQECLWADIFGTLPRVEIPLGRFGAGDCRRHSHLFFFRRRPSFLAFVRRVHAATPGHACVHQLQKEAVVRLPALLDVERSERRARGPGAPHSRWPVVPSLR